LPSEQTGIVYKKENRRLSISPIKKKTRNKSQIPYDYKVGDQVLVETTGILRKFSIPFTGPYTVTNVYKNGTIRNQNWKRKCIRELKRVNIRRITSFNPKPN
jgi:hypothetical protein